MPRPIFRQPFCITVLKHNTIDEARICGQASRVVL